MNNKLIPKENSLEEFLFGFIDFIWEVDAQGVYTHASGDLLRVLGYTSEELIGKTPFDLMTPDEAIRVGGIFENIVQNRSDIVDLVNWNIRKDGSKVCLLTNGKPILSQDGALLGYRGIDKDVTAIQLANEKTILDEKKYREFFEVSQEGIFIMKKGVIVDANPQFATILGYTHEELIGTSCTDIIHKVQSDGLQVSLKMETMLDRVMSGEEVTMEWTHKHKDGHTIETEVNAQKIHYIGDSLILGSLRDISVKKIKEHALADTNMHLELALDAAKAGTVLFDMGEDKLYWDEASLKMFGLNETTFGNDYASWEKCVHPADSEKLFSEIQQQFVSAKYINAQYRVVHPNGDIRHILIVAAIIRDDKGNPTFVTGLHFDKTEEVLLHQKLQKATQDAKIANEAKSVFLATMSHELRTPLNAVLGFVNLARKESGLTPKTREYLDIIEGSGSHLIEIINQVLDLSQIESGNVEVDLQAFNLLGMLQECATLMAVKAHEKNLQLMPNFSTLETVNVISDTSKIRQIILNILGNAVKYTTSGHIDFKVQVISVGDTHILRIVVKDTGAGIDAQALPHIFEPFTQSRSSDYIQGSGLGLAVTKTLVHLLKGDIEVDSTLDKGSCFTVEIPILFSEETLEISRKKEVVGLKSDADVRRILIVDDIRVNRLLIRSFLEEIGFIIDEAKDGVEAVEKFESFKPDLIWMDLQMPRLSGCEATLQIRQRSQDTKCKILALSANAIDIETTMKKCAFDDYLVKPFDEFDLFEMMKKHLKIHYIYK